MLWRMGLRRPRVFQRSADAAASRRVVSLRCLPSATGGRVSCAVLLHTCDSGAGLTRRMDACSGACGKVKLQLSVSIRLALLRKRSRLRKQSVSGKVVTAESPASQPKTRSRQIRSLGTALSFTRRRWELPEQQKPLRAREKNASHAVPHAASGRRAARAAAPRRHDEARRRRRRGPE